MIGFGNTSKLLIIGIIAFGALVILSYFINLTPYQLAIEMRSSSDGYLQVFYASDGNYSEENSVKVFVRASEHFETYSIELKKANIMKIRIDPISDFNIKSVEIFNKIHSYQYDGQMLFESIVPLHDIKSVNLINNQVVGVAGGEDPFFNLTNLPKINPTYTIVFIVLSILIFAIIFLLFYILWEYWLRFDYAKQKSTNGTYALPESVFYSLLIIVFLWFLFQTVFYATNIDRGIAPDENYHLLLSSYQSETFNIYNHDSPRSFYLGAISVRPYLYHMIMGKLLMLKTTTLSDIVFLRLVNVILSLITLFLTFLLAKEISKNKLIQLATVVIQTNILMYVFLSSMVTYDNLTNLISVASFVVLIRFLKTYSRRNLLLLIITMTIGALTKITYGPLIIIQLIILVYHAKPIWYNRQKILTTHYTVTDKFLIALALLLFGLNVHLYGNNLIKYEQVQPKTVNVFGHEKAYKYYSQYQRAHDLKSTRSEKTLMRFDEYLIKYLMRTGDTIFGICGHKNLLRSNVSLFFYGLLGLLSLLIYILKYKQLKNNSYLKIVLFSFLSYALIILLTNYISYRSLGSFGLALQGRYNFPVYALANVFIAYNLFFLFKERTKTVVLICLSCFFVYSGFFWSLSKFTIDWFHN